MKKKKKKPFQLNVQLNEELYEKAHSLKLETGMSLQRIIELLLEGNDKSSILELANEKE